MSDPNVYPNFPGFPQESNAHLPPPLVRDPRSGRLHPAISRADQDRDTGARNRSRYGPPPGGWPVGKMEGLTPLKQRLITGMQQIAEQFTPALGPNVQMLTGAIMGVMSEKVKDAPDEAIIKGLTQFVGMISYWIGGEQTGAKAQGDIPQDGTNQAR